MLSRKRRGLVMLQESWHEGQDDGITDDDADKRVQWGHRWEMYPSHIDEGMGDQKRYGMAAGIIQRLAEFQPAAHVIECDYGKEGYDRPQQVWASEQYISV